MRIENIDNRNKSLTKKYGALLGRGSLREQVISSRARVIADRKIEEAKNDQFEGTKPKSFFEMSDGFAENLQAMSTRFNRTATEESKLPFRSIYNPTVDRMKRSEMVRFEKNIANFVV